QGLPFESPKIMLNEVFTAIGQNQLAQTEQLDRSIGGIDVPSQHIDGLGKGHLIDAHFDSDLMLTSDLSFALPIASHDSLCHLLLIAQREQALHTIAVHNGLGCFLQWLLVLEMTLASPTLVELFYLCPRLSDPPA